MEVNALAHRHFSGQGAGCPDRFGESDVSIRNFPGVTPAPQYSPKLTAQIPKVKLRLDLWRSLVLVFNPGKNFSLVPDERSAKSAKNLRPSSYLTSTVAPASASFCLTVSASSFETPSLTALGAASTRSFASFRPSAVTSRTTLMTLILLPPAA